MNYALEKNFGEILTVDKKPKKENTINRIVVENFGDWNNFRRIIKDAQKNIDYNPLENKSTQKKFTRGVLQSKNQKRNTEKRYERKICSVRNAI